MFGDALSKLAGNVVRYFNHYLFLGVCDNLKIVPNGLIIKKTPCVGNCSQSLLAAWSKTLTSTGAELVNILKEEYREKFTKTRLEFWNCLSTLLDTSNFSEFSGFGMTLLKEF